MTCRTEYVIITPVRDEEKHIEKTLNSVISQTITPTEWVIVNDGSIDQTGRIVDEYARSFPWIHAVHLSNRGFRKAGGGVVEAFYSGYKALKTKKWNFIVKLDGDLSFASDYFEKCFNYFQTIPNLGVGGGIIYNIINGSSQIEREPLFHVRGATKIYKKDCWESIGGLLSAPGWDTLDEVKANMLGWKTRTFVDLKVSHWRPTGFADGIWKSGVKYGRANHISGYHPLFMFFKCIKRSLVKPYLIGAIAIAYGYISGYVQKVPRIDDQMLIDYLRNQQMKRLMFRESIWK